MTKHTVSLHQWSIFCFRQMGRSLLLVVGMIAFGFGGSVIYNLSMVWMIGQY